MAIAQIRLLGISAPQVETGRRRDRHFEPGGDFFGTKAAAPLKKPPTLGCLRHKVCVTVP
jgi:hypothetical protein